jgi:hypothetical protein
MTVISEPHPYVSDRRVIPGEERRPLFSGLDVVCIVAAIIMALGPLTAYTVGL